MNSMYTKSGVYSRKIYPEAYKPFVSSELKNLLHYYYAPASILHDWESTIVQPFFLRVFEFSHSTSKSFLYTIKCAVFLL